MRQRKTKRIRGSRQVEKDANHFCLSLYLSHHQDLVRTRLWLLIWTKHLVLCCFNAVLASVCNNTSSSANWWYWQMIFVKDNVRNNGKCYWIVKSVKSIKTTKCKAQKQKTTPEKSAKTLEKGAFSFQKKYRNSDEMLLWNSSELVEYFFQIN